MKDKMNESEEWPPPPHQHTVTADASKACFIPFDGIYLTSWLILFIMHFVSLLLQTWNGIQASLETLLAFLKINLMSKRWNVMFTIKLQVLDGLETYPNLNQSSLHPKKWMMLRYGDFCFKEAESPQCAKTHTFPFSSIHFIWLSASRDESPPCSRLPAFTLLLSAAIVSMVMMLTSVAMTDWGQVETDWADCCVFSAVSVSTVCKYKFHLGTIKCVVHYLVSWGSSKFCIFNVMLLCLTVTFSHL